MKPLYSCIAAFLMIPSLLNAQSFEWVYSNEASYNLNPALPVNMVCASANGSIYNIYFHGDKYAYGTDIYGTDKIEAYSPNGDLQWSLTIGSRALATSAVADDEGNLYVFGSFMKNLVVNGTDSLENTGGNLSVNLFLLCIDAGGNLAWKRNISVEHGNDYLPGAIALNPDQQLWYAIGDFFESLIYQVDDSGNDQTSFSLTGSKALGGMSFDEQGNLFVSGATSIPSLTVVNLEVNVPEQYMMYVARINAAGEATWAQLASDITFQRPIVKTDANGGAYVSGNLMAATSFGAISFLQPQWVYDIFLTRVDSNGNFLWGLQAPQDPGGITGDFGRGVNSFMTVDKDNRVYLAGTTRGTLDWGNGVTSEAPSLSQTSLTIISFDESGTALWAKDGGSEEFNQAGAVAIDEQGEVYFSATITGEATFDTAVVNNGGDFASVIGKLSADVATYSPYVQSDTYAAVYPNPFYDLIHLDFKDPVNAVSSTLDIFDVAGKSIARYEWTGSAYPQHLSTASIPSGVYMVRLQSGSNLLVHQKMIKAE